VTRADECGANRKLARPEEWKKDLETNPRENTYMGSRDTRISTSSTPF
jgi:hypothetical protein